MAKLIEEVDGLLAGEGKPLHMAVDGGENVTPVRVGHNLDVATLNPAAFSSSVTRSKSLIGSTSCPARALRPGCR